MYSKSVFDSIQINFDVFRKDKRAGNKTSRKNLLLEIDIGKSQN